MQANYRYSWALSEIRRGTPLLQMYESGLTPDQVKEAVVELLDPYFENQSLLVENAISILLPEAVSIARLNNDAWSLQMINQCLATHRGARAASAIDSLQGCSAWVPATMRGLSAYWSHLHLEHDKNALALDEFAHECLAVIGSLIEGSIQPYLKELLHQIRISRGEPVTVDQLESLTLGNIIDELIRNSGYPELFAPLPWGIRLNQWRNIAQLVLWNHTKAAHVTVEYQESDGTPNFRVSVNETNCDLLQRGEIDSRQFMNRIEMTDLKTGTVIPPLPEGGS